MDYIFIIVLYSVKFPEFNNCKWWYKSISLFLEIHMKVFRGDICNWLSNDSRTIKIVITMRGERDAGGVEGWGGGVRYSKMLTIDGSRWRVYACSLNNASNFSVGLQCFKNKKSKRRPILRSCGVV